MWNCCHFGASSVYTIQPCISLQYHFIWSHGMHVCLAVTSPLHFWQNDQDLLCATAVTCRWNEYQNKSQHRKLTLEKKIILPLLQGLRPKTFWSQVCHSTTEPSLLPGGSFQIINYQWLFNYQVEQKQTKHKKEKKKRKLTLLNFGSCI